METNFCKLTQISQAVNAELISCAIACIKRDYCESGKGQAGIVLYEYLDWYKSQQME